MRIALASVLLFVAAAAGCGGSSTPTIDSPPADLQVVACGGATIASTVTVIVNGTSFMFSPMNPSVHVGDIIEFNTTATHPVASGTPSAPDGKFNTNGDACVKYTKAGTFPFFCSVHLFTGTVTVQ